MILKELVIKRKTTSAVDKITTRNLEKWKNITNATTKLITYILITKNSGS